MAQNVQCGLVSTQRAIYRGTYKLGCIQQVVSGVVSVLESKIQWFHTCLGFLEFPVLWELHFKHNSNFALPFSVKRQLSQCQGSFRCPLLHNNSEYLESNLHFLRCSPDRNSFGGKRFSFAQIHLCLGGHPPPRDTAQIATCALKL